MDDAACLAINMYLVQIFEGNSQLLSAAVPIFQRDLKVIRKTSLDGV